MTDRELLEAAAKAAGLALTWGEKYKLGDDIIDCTDIPYAASNQPDESDVHWNPLTDDGDALRLAVKLRLEVSWWRNALTVETDDKKATSGIVGIGDDPYAATRRAIVRAAAAMVKP